MLIFVRIVFGGLRTVGWLHAIVAVAGERYVVGSVGRGVGLEQLGVYDSSAQDKPGSVREIGPDVSFNSAKKEQDQYMREVAG